MERYVTRWKGSFHSVSGHREGIKDINLIERKLDSIIIFSKIETKFTSQQLIFTICSATAKAVRQYMCANVVMVAQFNSEAYKN